jgi:uncharacterized repeat protein (TIGR01451 family)
MPRASVATAVIARVLGLVVALVLLVSGRAFAQQVQVNKAFSPSSVVLGGQTTVTVSLQNSSTTSAATISSFTDDISTMAGVGQIFTTFTPATTCTGGTPSISGTQIVMTSGSIPIAPSSSTPGTCTITFKVYGDAVGNGFNTIPAASVVTSNGSPPADVTQTLTVQSTTIAVTAAAAITVQTGDTTTVTYTIVNPTNGNTGTSAPVAISNVGFAITSNATSAYTVTGATISAACGGTFVLPAAGGTTGTTTFSGLTIPSGQSCVITLSATTPTAETVNYLLPLSPTAGYITDAQNVTNAAGVSAQAKFVSGQPNVTKSFAPTSAAAGGTSVMKISIQNVLSDYSFTTAHESDTLPGTLLVSATAPTATGCGTPTYGGAGTGTFTITGATIAPGATCSVSVTVNVPAGQAATTLTNTIPLANFGGTLSGGTTTITGAAAAATAQLVVTAAGGGISSTKVASPTSAGVNVPVKITVTFTSQGAGVFHGGTFTDALPQTLVPMVALTDAAHIPTYTAGCSSQGDTPAAAFGGTGGNESVTFTGLDIAANGTCAVSFFVEFPNQSGVSRVDTNAVSAASFVNASAATVGGGTPAANITELPTFTVTSYVASNSGLTSQPQLVSSTVNVPAGFTDTGGTVVINLTAGKVSLAASPQITFANCPATAAVTSVITGNPESFTVALGAATLSQTCTISYYVVDESAAVGSFTPIIPTYSSPLTGNIAQSGTAQNNVTFTAPQPIGITKAYTPANQIQAGGTATAVISLVIPKAGTLAVTQANGVGFTDNLPTNLNFSPTPNVGFTGCGASGQPVPSYVIAGSSITFSNLTVTTTGTTQTTCAVNFDVTSNVVGAPLNQIPAGAVTSTSGAGAANTAVAKASLTVSAGLGIQKTFVNTTLQIGGTDYVRLLITNTATPSNLSGGTLTDGMPASLVLASTTEGLAQGGDPALCGGTITGTVGSSSFTLHGLAVTGDIGGVAGQCVVYVQVAPAATAAPGSVTNTIASGAVNIGGYSNQNAGSGTVTLTAPPAPGLTKAFAPATIAPGGTSVLTITITNAATGAAPLSALALTDTLPVGVTIAATPNATTTCGAGSVTAASGASSVALAAGSIAAAGSCTIAVNVTSPVAGSYLNMIPAASLTDSQGATNAASATATLQVAAPVSVAKTFLPTSIASGTSSVLTITIINTAGGSVTVSGLALNDTLPAGVSIAATPNATTTCGAGTVSALAAGTSIALSNGSVGAGVSCAITVSVTGTVAGVYTNTIPANAIADSQGTSNGAAASAQLTIVPAPLSIAKTFAPASIASGGTAMLTITIPNTASGAVALSALALTDTLPANVTIAAAANASTTCGAGTLTAAPGSASVALSGGSVAANASCTIAVNVTGNIANAYTNTIAPGALTDTQTVSNGNTASALLTITAGAPTLTKAFLPTAIASGASSVLTITIANTATGAIPLTGVTLSDPLPTGVTISATPNASTTCGAGTLTAAGGSTSVMLAAGSVGANASCTISVNVTGTVANSYTNSIPANALVDTQGLSNASAASAGLTIVPAAVTIAKVFSPASIAAGGLSTLTITIPNTASGAVALGALALTDTLPGGVTIAPAPNAATTCGAGSVAASAGGSTVALTGGSLAVNGSCTITVNVTGSVANTYTNTIPASSMTDTQNVTNGNSATAPLTITPASTVLTKSFAPASITSGGVSTLTITIPNTAGGAVALSALALTDTLPVGVTIAATPSAATTCGGTITANAGGPSVALSGGALAANASCTITVRVTGTIANAYTNTIPASALTDTQNVTNAAPATAGLTIVPGAISLNKAFAPTSILSGGTSTLTITIPNTAAGAIALTNLALSDALPSGITVGATPNAATTCSAGTVTAAAGSGTVALAGGTLGANATCTITVTVTGTIANAYTNTIPATALGDTQGITNSTPASAAITITPNTLALSKAFAPASIRANGTSVLTITIPNTAVGAVALSAMTLTDALPASVTIAAVPNASTTCGAGTMTAAAGAASVALAGGSLAANATCTIAVSVTGAIANSYTNTIPANALGDTQGVSNASPATAALTIVPAGLTIAKAFAPASIAAGGLSTLTITIPNTAPGAIALSGLTLSDVLPAGITIAATPNAATTCGGGTVTAAAGASSIALAGGSIAAGATCAIAVSVTGRVTNTYTNTIPAAALTDTQNVTNATAATAALAITANAVGLSKAFAPATISAGGTSVLTVMIANTSVGAIALTGVSLTDALPAGLTIAATPGAVTTCGAGSVAAPAGSTNVTLGGGSIAANATCTIKVNVTGGAPNTYTNTIPAGGLTDVQGTSNTAPATATLVVTTATLAVIKSSSPSAATVGPGETILYTIAVTNNGSAPETNATVTDTLTNATLVPGSVRVNRRPASDTVITSGAAFGTIPAGGAATITYSATVLASVSSGATVTNSATAGGDIPCSGPVCTASSPPNSVQLPILSVVKSIDALTRDTVLLGQTVTYSMTITNTGTGPAAQVVLTDPVPVGVTPLAGSVTLNGGAAAGATVAGQNVTVPIVLLAPGATAIVAFQGTITSTAVATLTNVVSIGAAGLQSVVHSNPVVAQLVPSTLQVTKTTNATTATAGDRVDYVITVAPVNGIGYTATTITDALPSGETFAPGTARVNGRPVPPVLSGRVLTWTLPSLTAPVTLTYSTVIAAGVQQNQQLTNTVTALATAPGGAPAGRGSASASVLITSSTFGSCYPITGRVYLDVNGSGHFHDPDAGIAAVHIYLDNGESIVTDTFGRYDFPCVQPGMHALRLDEQTLPPGVVPFDDRNIDSEKSTRRLVHHIFDTSIIEDINFAVSGNLAKPDAR